MEVERPVSRSSSAAPGGFTEADLAAADQLVQLSVSGGGEAAASSSSTLSGRSVNNAGADAADDDDDAAWLDRRETKRYRRVAELYRATRPAKGRRVGGMRNLDEEAGKS